jgi:DNA polymerase III epsilon subunit-like protein
MDLSKLKLKKPLVIFDLETTGTDLSKDRIVEIAMIKVHPDGTVEKSLRHAVKRIVCSSIRACLFHWKQV